MVKIYPEALSNNVRNDPGKRAEVKLYDTLSNSYAAVGLSSTMLHGWDAQRRPAHRAMAKPISSSRTRTMASSSSKSRGQHQLPGITTAVDNP